MGYDLYITRKELHFDEEGPQITESEWKDFIEQSPEFEFNTSENGELFAEWTKAKESGCMYPDAWLDWHEGCIYTKNPDEVLINKMLEIAKHFDAKVQGDDGEIYKTPTDHSGSDENIVFQLPINKTQMYLSRGAICVVFLLIITLLFVPTGNISIEKIGDENVYQNATYTIPIITAVLGVIVTVAGIVFWMYKILFMRILSIVLFLVSIFLLVISPTGLNHKVTVGPNSFQRQVGWWFSPSIEKVVFSDAKQVIQSPIPDNQDKIQLEWTMKSDDKVIVVPVYTLMQEALPEILKRAKDNGVEVIDKTQY